MITIDEYKDGGLFPAVGLHWHTFSDGCPHINMDEHICLDLNGGFKGKRYVVTYRGGDPGGLFPVEIAIDLLKKLGAEHVTRFLPYLPGARQDHGLPRTADIVAGFKSVADLTVFADPHSYVLPKLMGGVNFIIPVVNIIDDIFMQGGGMPLDGLGIIAPDAGARERAKEVAERYDLPLFMGSKTRDPKNKFRIKSFECEPITTKRALVIDDICDGGGTFLALAEVTGLSPENLGLWTTHGIYSKGLHIMRERFGFIACSDSLLHPDYNRRVTKVVSLTPHLIDILKVQP